MINPKHYLADSRRDVVAIIRQAGQLFYEHRKPLWLLVMVCLILVLAILPHDLEWLHLIQGTRDEDLKQLARKLSFWGDWYVGTVLLCGMLWLLAWILPRQYIRQAALGCLMAALLSGLFGDVFRYGLGRARPNSGVVAGLYGPTLNSHFHSFPSGHTTTAFGTAVALSVLFPPLTLPALTVASGVAWSRLYLNYHHPSDILMGSVLGGSFGWVFGHATRRVYRKTQKKEGENTPEPDK
ncbi:MAG: phosphatase PAP2 family protein [Methylococcaceae bacterium]